MMLQGIAPRRRRGLDTWTAGVASVIALGLGTALVYPTFLSAVSDHSHPSWRATKRSGVYRW